ncbi:hypothetical protein OIU91_04110 [Streptomyces sp. NBC_01456]|uniref:hypothetical protein n=1 Tax=unclassified Streptomyces TaxID=2593676 RepID=UPI002E35B9AF|nr:MULTISPECIES: hypothetical protein [unclassified Streptomyces]
MFAVGDLVGFDIETDDGFTERHYATIEQFRKRDGNNYRRKPTQPYAAFLAPEHSSTQVLPLTKLTQAVDDFEIITDHSTIHADAREWNDWYFKCLRCGGFTYKGAEVMAIHKQSGQRVRLCNDCYKPEELARLGHHVMFYGRDSREIIAALTANPEPLVGPARDSYYEKSEGESYREWADAFPWLVPVPAAELYEQWKGERDRASAAA